MNVLCTKHTIHKFAHVCELFGEFLLEGQVTIMLVVNHQVSTDCE